MQANALYERLTELATFENASFIDDHAVQLSLAYKDHAQLTKHSKTGHVILGDQSKPTRPIVTSFVPRDSEVKREFEVKGLSNWHISLRESGGETKKRRFVEVWNAHQIRVKSIEVSDVHGAFVGDDVFSTFSAVSSHDDRIHILYSASLNDVSHDSSKPDPLSRFGFNPPIGEKYRRSFRPAVFLLRTGGKQETLMHQLEPAKESRIWSSASFLPGGADGAPDQAVAVAHDTLPNHRRLGEVFCTNRPMSVWRVPLPKDDAQPRHDGKATSAAEKLSKAEVFSTKDQHSAPSHWSNAQQLSSTAYSARCPRVAPSNTQQPDTWSLIWLETPLGGPHSTASHLALAQGRNAEITTQPQRLSIAREDVHSMSIDHNIGLYVDQLPSQPFLRDPETGQQLFGLTTIDGSRRRAVVFDFNGHERELNYGWAQKQDDDANLSWAFLAGETSGGRFLLQCSGPARPPSLLIDDISRFDDAPVVLFSVSLPTEDLAALGIQSTILRVPGTALTETESLDTRDIEAILIQPGKQSATQASGLPPCILFPHGGPHSTTTTDWSAALTATVLSGYSVVLPNYHGSLGRSPFFVTSLMGRCGQLDVSDCLKTIDHVISLGIASKDNVYYQGGSHGGFIGTHLLSREPHRWKAVALRNPVTHIGDMWSDTDIPDWCLSEVGEDYAFDNPPTHLGEERYGKLEDASPLPYVENDSGGEVLPPTLLLVASSDQRVPPTQGLSLYHSLRARESRDRAKAGGEAARGSHRTHCCWFEDPDAGHGLESIEAARGAWGATSAWFEQWVNAK